MTKSWLSYPLSAPRVTGRRLVRGAIRVRAARRSAWPEARVVTAPTIRPLRFSISAWPMKHSRASLPGPLRKRRASGSVVEACVSFLRRSPWKSRSRVAARCGRLARAVLRAKALQARPHLQQRAVDREVLARQQPFDLVLRQHRGQKLGRHIALQQPVAVLGEGRGIPHWVLDAEPDKPAKQQIIVDPLDQLPFRADRIERLQQQRAHQPLRRDRLPADRRIQLGELASQRFERRIGNLANHPQRMIRPNPLLKIYVAEKPAVNPIVDADRLPIPHPKGSQCANSATLFSA